MRLFEHRIGSNTFGQPAFDDVFGKSPLLGGGKALSLEKSGVRAPKRIGGDRYKILSTLGLGGFGEVFLAEGPSGLVAVKAVDTAGWNEREYRVFNALMVSEASFLSTLSHPALPKLREFFAESSCYYLVMDWVSGQTLENAVLCEGCFPLEEGFRMLGQLLRAFEYLHDECRPAVIFGDLKPANILRTREGDYRLVDLGLVTREGNRLTGDFAVYSPPYSAPERAHGQPSSKRHDVYSLAATMVYVLTGRAPVGRDVESSLRTSSERYEASQMKKHRAEQVLTVLLTCLQEESSARPATLRPLRAALERWSSFVELADSRGEDHQILRGLYGRKPT